MITLSFVAGTLELRNVEDADFLPEGCLWDPRTQCYRAPAMAYHDVLMGLVQNSLKYEDKARGYQNIDPVLKIHRAPRPFQTESVDAWRKARYRGVIVLPTGSGKSHVAVMAILKAKRSALIVVPTLDLVRQWYDLLRTSFALSVGIIGGGEFSVEPLTVITYDSAYIHMEHLGNKFGLIIYDECHHLPGAAYGLAAQSCLAPFRMGLTATLERADERHHELDQLIGPVIYRQEVTELKGEYLAEYTTERIVVELLPEEREAYERERGIYRDFIETSGIRMSSASGWTDFIIQSSISNEGRRAMKAYQRQKELAFRAASKMEYVDFLLHQHRTGRILLFTQDNATAYEVSRRFLIPIITHQTKITERSEILERFAKGTYGAIVTSKVLNEGVDVPDASVAIVISGSGSVREHVQRLGRILRKKGGKSAILYELVSGGTTEDFTSQRRREHVAYR